LEALSSKYVMKFSQNYYYYYYYCNFMHLGNQETVKEIKIN